MNFSFFVNNNIRETQRFFIASDNMKFEKNLIFTKALIISLYFYRNKFYFFTFFTDSNVSAKIYNQNLKTLVVSGGLK